MDIDKDTVDGICLTTGVEIANINAPDNIVVAGDDIKLAKARRLAGVKAHAGLFR